MGERSGVSRLPEPLATLRAAGVPGWAVGGSVRDRLLERPTSDYDIVTSADAGTLARDLARTLRAHAFRLSESFGVWRVVARGRWQLDVLPVHPDGLDADLAARDLTINAIAEPLGGGEPVDPFGGRADLAAGRLRMVGPGAFVSDPLRVLRLIRLACELGFSVEADTAEAARRSAPALAGVAAERVFAELRRVLASDRVLDGLALMDAVGATAAILPGLGPVEGGAAEGGRAGRGVLVEGGPAEGVALDAGPDLPQRRARPLLGAVVALERDPARAFGGGGAELDALLSAPLADEVNGWTALRLGGLLHDVRVPDVTGGAATRPAKGDVARAALADELLGRLRAASRLREHVAALVRHARRLGALVEDMPLDRRAVYRYLRACEPVEVEATVLGLACHLAEGDGGFGNDPGVVLPSDPHLVLAREIMSAALAWRARRPRPPLRGDELVRELGVVPGPGLGVILGELEEAAYAGDVADRDEALAWARDLVAVREASRADR